MDVTIIELIFFSNRIRTSDFQRSKEKEKIHKNPKIDFSIIYGLCTPGITRLILDRLSSGIQPDNQYIFVDIHSQCFE